MITGMRASDNNHGQTVLSLFVSAAQRYGVPSRLRGDHGVENIWVAAFMEHAHGEGRGSYIWGRYGLSFHAFSITYCFRSVHNVRIEHLWVDVSHYCSQIWHDLFTTLELRHGLDVSNVHHIWLLQHLFLGPINEQLTFWAESWNQHRISQSNRASRSPEDMFGFDMLVNGFRGNSLEHFSMTDEELEVFGVDWEGLQDEVLLQSLRRNYNHEGSSSWLGRRGPPPDLNEVVVDPPSGPLTPQQIATLDEQVQGFVRQPQEAEVALLWINALASARAMEPTLF